jgi:hypothetical protein
MFCRRGTVNISRGEADRNIGVRMSHAINKCFINWVQTRLLIVVFLGILDLDGGLPTTLKLFLFMFANTEYKLSQIYSKPFNVHRFVFRKFHHG